MNVTTISIKKETKKELKKLQERYKVKSMDDLINKLIIETKKKFVDDFSKDFKQRLEEKGMTLNDIMESGEEIRKEIWKEWNQQQ